MLLSTTMSIVYAILATIAIGFLGFFVAPKFIEAIKAEKAYKKRVLNAEYKKMLENIEHDTHQKLVAFFESTGGTGRMWRFGLKNLNKAFDQMDNQIHKICKTFSVIENNNNKEVVTNLSLATTETEVILSSAKAILNIAALKDKRCFNNLVKEEKLYFYSHTNALAKEAVRTINYNSSYFTEETGKFDNDYNLPQFLSKEEITNIISSISLDPYKDTRETLFEELSKEIIKSIKARYIANEMAYMLVD